MGIDQAAPTGITNGLHVCHQLRIALADNEYVFEYKPNTRANTHDVTVRYDFTI